MPNSRAHRHGNSHYIPGPGNDDHYYDAYPHRSQHGQGSFSSGIGSDGGEDGYFDEQELPLRQSSFPGRSGQVTARRPNNLSFDEHNEYDDEPTPRRPKRGQLHRQPLSFPEDDEQDDFLWGEQRYRQHAARPSSPNGFDGSSSNHGGLERGARYRFDDFEDDSREASGDEADDDAWGPPDDPSESMPKFDDRGGLHDQGHRGSGSARERLNFGIEIGKPRSNRRERSLSPVPGPAFSRGRRQPAIPNNHRGNRPPMSTTGSSIRGGFPSPSSASSASGSDLGRSLPLNAKDSDEELLRAIELSRLADEEHIQKQQDEQIERLVEQSKADALALEVKKDRQRQRQLRKQERDEQEAIKASRVIAKAQNRKQMATEEAFIEESRKEARKRERKRERREMEQAEWENDFIEESRREAEMQNAILEASRREVEAKEEEELARVLEQSRLEALNDRRSGGIAVSQSAAREGSSGRETSASSAPSRQPPARQRPVQAAAASSQAPPIPPPTDTAASDSDMEGIMLQIAELEARQAQAERELSGGAHNNASSNNGLLLLPRTAAQIEGDNEEALRNALAQSLGDEGAPVVDPEDGDPNPPPSYGEALAEPQAAALVGEGRRRRRHGSQRSERVELDGQSQLHPRGNGGDRGVGEGSAGPLRRKHRRHRDRQVEERPEEP
ncbi:MAG: hypothetical protein M1835_006806 [Candelina submexicana]|nr:MAG: hypothetical protein M1835_006806 [Candelina submexicana]